MVMRYREPQTEKGNSSSPALQEAVYCVSCGRKRGEGDRFCATCGRAYEGVSPGASPLQQTIEVKTGSSAAWVLLVLLVVGILLAASYANNYYQQNCANVLGYTVCR